MSQTTITLRRSKRSMSTPPIVPRKKPGHDTRHHDEADRRTRVVGDARRDREDRDQTDPVARARRDLREPQPEVRRGPEDPPGRWWDGCLVRGRRDERGVVVRAHDARQARGRLCGRDCVGSESTGDRPSAGVGTQRRGGTCALGGALGLLGRALLDDVCASCAFLIAPLRRLRWSSWSSSWRSSCRALLGRAARLALAAAARRPGRDRSTAGSHATRHGRVDRAVGHVRARTGRRARAPLHRVSGCGPSSAIGGLACGRARRLGWAKIASACATVTVNSCSSASRLRLSVPFFEVRARSGRSAR